MNVIKSKQFYVILSLVCAVAMLLMSTTFQSMAYWGEGLTWFWVGVSCTYLLWLMGIVFLAVAITKRTDLNPKLSIGVSIMGIVSFILLLCGFGWTTFIIIFGLSGL
ncbi:hypothetical protein [Ornithinibacillus halophilus]|uniref:Uncharacterized protein n=1 Tax=Ornithinibacillus halophilus TaxID=930117 RepID=A0A1M5KUV1_9BACI|nr:hypothetical protein [Ornithinibacillus halophilus]SHG56516.1 hypothetical protein SAMN05216225_104127 [Ornithinibacillus halophilus]